MTTNAGENTGSTRAQTLTEAVALHYCGLGLNKSLWKILPLSRWHGRICYSNHRGEQPVLLIKRSRHLGLSSAGRRRELRACWRSRSKRVDDEKFVFVFVCSRTASAASPVHLWRRSAKKSDAAVHVSHYLNAMRCAGGKSAIQWEKCCWHDVQCSNAAKQPQSDWMNLLKRTN